MSSAAFLARDDVELGPLSEEVLTDLAPLAENNGIALDCSGDALTIGSDTLLYRLVFNLVENAIRYSRSSSTVNVSISDSDSHVLLRVKDEGPGIPKQYRESIFQPFFSSRQIPQQGIRRRRTRASACLGDCSPTRRHGRGRNKFRERDYHARKPSKTICSVNRTVKLERGPVGPALTKPRLSMCLYYEPLGNQMSTSMPSSVTSS